MIQKMVILAGLPASGKSSYAMDLMTGDTEAGITWARINWDTLRKERGLLGKPFSRSAEEAIQAQGFQIAKDMWSRGFNLIIDNTNLSTSTVNKWLKFAADHSMEVEKVTLPTSVEECIFRDSLRTGFEQVGRIVIERMALNHGLIKWPDKPIVIVDMDGTLADNSHRTHFIKKTCQKCYDNDERKFCDNCGSTGWVNGVDWKTFLRPELILADPPHSAIVDWVRALAPDHTIVICSGRDAGNADKATVAWLQKNEVPYHHIFMRNPGDRRDDTIVKQNILDKLPREKIAFCIDDRKRVCDMWKQNGLRVFNVSADGIGDF
jgi:predicted kinase/RNA polymerase subunit RPABC4/transcription elongation factor Spt4